MNCDDQQQRYREDKIWDNQQEIMKTEAKQRVITEYRMQQEQRKMQLSEIRRQAHKAEYTELHVLQNGELMLHVQTPLINVPERRAANFRFVDAVELRSTGGESGVICVFMEVDGREEKLFLNEKIIGKEGYFLKKLNQIGGQLYISKKSQKNEILYRLWGHILTHLSRLGESPIEIPEREGWNVTQCGEILFAGEGETLWENIWKMAK